MKITRGRTYKRMIVFLFAFILSFSSIPASSLFTAYADPKAPDGVTENIDDPASVDEATEAPDEADAQIPPESEPIVTTDDPSDLIIMESAILDDASSALEPLDTETPLEPLATGSIRVSGLDRYDYTYTVLDTINTARANDSKPQLILNQDLTIAAMQRAAEIAVLGTDTRPDGSAWYTASSILSIGDRGELLAIGNTTPSVMVNAWVGAYPEIILYNLFRTAGIGVFEHNGMIYWVLLFSSYASPAPLPQQVNVNTTRTMTINSTCCTFTGAMIISDSTVAVGQGKSCYLIVCNAGLPSTSNCFFRPDSDYGISWTTSNDNCLSAFEGTIVGLSVGDVFLRALIPEFLVVEFPITVTPGTIPGVIYRTHVQNDGDQAYVDNGVPSGTTNRALRLEGIWISLIGSDAGSSINYRTHVENIGWQDSVKDNMMAGTSNRALRLEAIEIWLGGNISLGYDVYYRVHAQNVGWMGWAKNGEQAGTAGYAFRLEAIQITLVPKGSPAPSDFFKEINAAPATPRMIDVNEAEAAGLSYSAIVHIQNIGDSTYYSANGATLLGTSGRALRLEAVTLNLINAPFNGGLAYQTHIQNIGWQEVRSSGQMSGTSGQALRLEAIRISLTGEMANRYDIYYCTHVQNIGWTGWAKNGQACGSANYAYRMEAIRIIIVPKGGVAPGLNTGYFYQQ